MGNYGRAAYNVLVAAILISCSGESADELFLRGEKATHKAADYADAEEALSKFLGRFSDDRRADVALQALARVYLTQRKDLEALQRYEELVRRFPESRFAPQAQFMVGYVFDQRGQIDEAREAYKKVIDRYPKSDLVDDAKVSIVNLGKPPEAWFPMDPTTK